jgi:hypothetical protein
MEQELESETQFIPISDESDDELIIEETEETQDIFSCPVCYTNGAESGIVTPSHCTHKICLECYTNIASRAPSPSCPMCRTDYLKTAVQPSTSPNTTSPPQLSPVITGLRRPVSANMNSDVMSLLIHRELPAYSYGSNIIYSLSDFERNQTIIDILRG